MPRLPILACLVLASFAAAAQPGPGSTIAQPQPGQPRVEAPQGGALGRTDRSFIRDAAQAGLAEIAAGQLALQRTRNSAIREYAQHLVKDHQDANARLAQIAQSRGVGVPTAPSAKQQRTLHDLQRVSAHDFDKRFLRQMVDDHQKAIDQFGHEVKGRHEDRDLKEFAQQTLPKLREHMAGALSLQKGRGGVPGA
jgi:putative membrane protein